MLTLVLVFVGPPSLSLELGAHLLKELGKTSARSWPRRAHATVRVVHVCCEPDNLIAMRCYVLQGGMKAWRRRVAVVTAVRQSSALSRRLRDSKRATAGPAIQICRRRDCTSADGRSGRR